MDNRLRDRQLDFGFGVAKFTFET
ncbi:unnamed protein product, partial [Rotaria sp. Silwood2]